jgi:virginiamycin B lyase
VTGPDAVAVARIAAVLVIGAGSAWIGFASHPAAALAGSSGVYVALGDSVAAGEGIQTSSGDPIFTACHRSTKAYPYLLHASGIPGFSGSFVDAACTGASLADILTTPQQVNGREAPVQFSRIPGGTVAAVTVTAGVDEPVTSSGLHWGDILHDCFDPLHGASNCRADAPLVGPWISRITTQLQQLVLRLQQLPGEPTIYLTGYYDPFPVGGIPADTSCDTLIGTDLSLAYGNGVLTNADGSPGLIRQWLAELNAAIANVAAQDGQRYVNLENAIPPSHRICEASLFTPTNWIINPSVSNTGVFWGWGKNQSPLHPNARGQQAIAEAIEARVSPGDTIREWRQPRQSQLISMTRGSDGNVWFSEADGKIGRITRTGAIKYFTPPAGSSPSDLALGADGNIWYTDGSRIGRVTPTGHFKSYPLPVGTYARKLVRGSGSTLWFSGRDGQVGTITTAGRATVYTLPTGEGPDDIAYRPADGDLWFVDGAATLIGRITPTGTVTTWPAPAGGTLTTGWNIRAVSNGDLWYTNNDEFSVSDWSPATLSVLHSADTYPLAFADMTAGLRSDAWLVGGDVLNETPGEAIGVIAGGQSWEPWSLPDNASAYLITRGGDGNYWFAADSPTGTYEIGRITPEPTLP